MLLDDTKSHYQLIIKITISEQKRETKLQIKRKGKFALKYYQRRRKQSKAATPPPTGNWAPKTQKQARTYSRNYNFEGDWLI